MMPFFKKIIGTFVLISQCAVLSLWVVLPTYAAPNCSICSSNPNNVNCKSGGYCSPTTGTPAAWVEPEDTSSTDMGLLQGISRDKLRNGDISFSDIPLAIQWATNFLLSIVGSISVVMIIVGAFRMAVGSISNDKSKGKDAITYGVYGLIVATSGWFILKLVIEGLF